MSLYDSTIKLFLVGEIPTQDISLFSSLLMAKAYTVPPNSRASGGLFVCDVNAPDIMEEISAPPTGMTFIVKAATGADELTTEFLSLWDEARLEKPTVIDYESKDAVIHKLADAVISKLFFELSGACKRNVSLRGQIAILREEIEQANIQLNQMEELVAGETTSAQSLLWQTDADGGFATLSPNKSFSQRLPLTINIWRLGAVSILTSAESDTTLDIRLRAMEDDSIIAEWNATVSTGVAWLHLPITSKIRSFYQLVYIDVENRYHAGGAINLGVGRLLNPDEALAENGKALDVSLALKLWAGTPLSSNTATVPATAISENLVRALIEAAGDQWITNSEPASEIEKPPKWFAKLDKQLKIHPSVGKIAAAKSFLSHDNAVDGILMDFSLTETDAQIVQCCIAAFSEQDGAPSPEDVAKLCELDVSALERYKHVYTSRWITAFPTTMIRDIPVFFERPLKDFSFYLLTRVAGNSASNCSAYFHNLRYVFRRPQ